MTFSYGGVHDKVRPAVFCLGYQHVENDDFQPDHKTSRCSTDTVTICLAPAAYTNCMGGGGRETAH